MDLRLSDEQEMLRAAVRSLCERLSSVEIVRSLEGDAKGYSEDLWTELGRMDLLGFLVDEDKGGSGWLPIEMSVVCEELGRALCPSPYVETAVFGAELLGRADRVVSLAWHEPERTDTEEGIAASTDGSTITGEKILVPFASAASELITLARDDRGVVLMSIDPDQPGVTLTFEGTLASDARYRVQFDRAAGKVVGRGWDRFLQATTPALVAVASYAVGAAARAHELSVAYATERVQFDRPIGAFQAMAHPLADLRTEIDGARTLVQQAAWTLAERRSDAPTLAAMAKYYACDVFRRTAKFGHQVFGGIGFTLDIDIQLFMRRAKQLEVTWFGPRRLEEVIAAAELDADVPLVTSDPVASGAK
ncbi:MAG: acyl-CoA dehydrogenase family protein [Actinomycetota bacterium]